MKELDLQKTIETLFYIFATISIYEPWALVPLTFLAYKYFYD